MHLSLKMGLQWRAQSKRIRLQTSWFPPRRYGGRRATDLAVVLKRKIRPAFEKLGITGVGWHTFRHMLGTPPAEVSEHRLAIRNYLRNSNLSVTSKYLQAASKTERDAQARLVETILPMHLLPGKRPNRLHPNCAQMAKVPKQQAIERTGGDDGTRTRGLCRDRATMRCN